MKTRIMNTAKAKLAGLGWLTRIVLLLVLLVQAGASAADIIWINTAGGNWNATANWSPNQLPGASDTAVITNDGTYAVTLNTSPTIAGLVLGGGSGLQTLAQSTYTLTLNGQGWVGSHGQWNFASGSLSGTNVVNIAGGFDWSGGTVNAYAVLSIATNGQLSVSGSGLKTFNGSLTNGGVVQYSGSTWRVNGGVNGGLLHNLPGSLFDFQSDTLLDNYSGSPVFVNQGTIRKSAGTGTATCDVPLRNTGRLEAGSGTLAYGNGSVFSTGTAFAGTGTNLLNAQSDSTLDGVLTSENLVWDGATLGGTGTLVGTAVWKSGMLNSGAALSIATNGQLSVSGTTKFHYGSLTNGGVIQFSGGDWRMNGGLVHNLPGSVFDFQSDSLLDNYSGSPEFVNQGTIRKSAGTGTATCDAPLRNTGRLEAGNGTLAYGNGSVFSTGTVFAGSGTNLLNAQSDSTLDGVITSENLVWDGATLGGSGTLVGLAVWKSGTLNSGTALSIATNGQLSVSGSGLKTLYGALTNGGVIQFSGSNWRVNGGLLHNLPGSLFDFQSDALLDNYTGSPEFVNQGTIRKSAGTGTATCDVPLRNTGRLEAGNGTLTYGNGSVFSTGTVFAGAGTNLLGALADSTLDGVITSENLVWDGATLSGSGTLVGTSVWKSGLLNSGTALSIATNGQLSVSGSGVKSFYGSLTNGGVIQFSGSNWRFGNAVLHNLSSGLLDSQTNGILELYTGSPLFVNEGTFRKSAGTGTTTCELHTINRGTVEINTGRIYFSGVFTNEAGTVRLGGGAFQATKPLDLGGGVLTGFGVVSNNVINNGVVSPSQTSGPLRIYSDYTQTLAGVAEFTMGGTNATVNHSQLQVTGNATYSGTLYLKWAPGYVPTAGDLFQVTTNKTGTGKFAFQQGIYLLGHNLRVKPTYPASGVVLETISAPDPVGPILEIACDGQLVIISWQPEFGDYVAQNKTNLLSPWNYVPRVMFSRMLDTPTLPEKYYRLIKE